MESKPKFRPDSELRLMDQVKQVLGNHYSENTFGFSGIPKSS
jgi:hypothetical protein